MDLSHFHWRKSSYSQAQGSDCVEVASNVPGVIGVRDSKNPGGGAHLLHRAGWRRFVAAVKTGKLER